MRIPVSIRDRVAYPLVLIQEKMKRHPSIEEKVDLEGLRLPPQKTIFMRRKNVDLIVVQTGIFTHLVFI